MVAKARCPRSPASLQSVYKNGTAAASRLDAKCPEHVTRRTQPVRFFERQFASSGYARSSLGKRRYYHSQRHLVNCSMEFLFRVELKRLEPHATWRYYYIAHRLAVESSYVRIFNRDT